MVLARATLVTLYYIICHFCLFFIQEAHIQTNQVKLMFLTSPLKCQRLIKKDKVFPRMMGNQRKLKIRTKV